MRTAEKLKEYSGKLLCLNLCSVPTAHGIVSQTALDATSATHWLMAATSASLSAAWVRGWQQVLSWLSYLHAHVCM